MRIDFYLVSESKKPEHVITTLTSKAYQKGWRIGIHCSDPAMLTLFDEALWNQAPNSFMPHSIVTSSRCQSSEEAIMLFSHAPDDIDTLDYYINFTGTMSQYNNTSGRLADIVQANETSKVAGRERYTYYKAQQHELHYHEL